MHMQVLLHYIMKSNVLLLLSVAIMVCGSKTTSSGATIDRLTITSQSATHHYNYVEHVAPHHYVSPIIMYHHTTTTSLCATHHYMWHHIIMCHPSLCDTTLPYSMHA